MADNMCENCSEDSCYQGCETVQFNRNLSKSFQQVTQFIPDQTAPQPCRWVIFTEIFFGWGGRGVFGTVPGCTVGCNGNCWAAVGRLRLKCDGTRAETRFGFWVKRPTPFKSERGSFQSTTAPPPPPCVTVCHHISNAVYQRQTVAQLHTGLKTRSISSSVHRASAVCERR
jgi:hypothetical protein